MAFSRVNPAGWALYEVLTSAQMNALDINVSRAVDGYAGGTYNPSAGLVWNNDLDVVGDSTLTGDLDVVGDLTLTGDLDVTGQAAFDSNGITGYTITATASAQQMVFELTARDHSTTPVAQAGIVYGGNATSGNNDGGGGLKSVGGDAYGSGTGGPGIIAVGGNSPSGEPGVSVECNRSVSFRGGGNSYQNPGVTTALDNELRGTNTVKAWCHATSGSSPGINDGVGFTSVASGGGNELSFTLAKSMRSGTQFAVIITQEDVGASVAMLSYIRSADNAFDVYARDYSGTLVNLNSTEIDFAVVVIGEHDAT